VSVADYIKNHYGPYMCNSGRHKWVTMQEATEKCNGFQVCAWCRKTRNIIYYTLMKACKRSNDNHLKKLLDIMSEENLIVTEAGVA